MALAEVLTDVRPGSNVLVMGRPRDIDGIGTGAVAELERRGCNAFIGCHWLKGLMRAEGVPTAHRLMRQYVDAMPPDLDAIVSVHTFLLDATAARSAFLWASDKYHAIKPFVIASYGDSDTKAGLANHLSDLVPSEPHVALFRTVRRRATDAPGISGSYAFGRQWIGDDDDVDFVPDLVKQRWDQRRRLDPDAEATPSDTPGP